MMMSLRLVLGFALCASPSGASTCEEGIETLRKFDEKCPKAEISTDEKEHTPNSCGMDDCGTFLGSLTDSAVEAMMTGLAACEGHATLSVYSTYSRLGADYVKVSLIMEVAKKCGHSDKVVVSAPSLDSCMGAIYKMFVGSSSECPEQCKEDRAEDGLPLCKEGQAERSLASCRIESCGAYLASIDDASLAKMMKGMESCKTQPNSAMSAYGAYADYGLDYFKFMFSSDLAVKCGQKDKLTFTMPTTDTCIGAVVMISALDQECPKECGDDGGLPKCTSGQEERTPSSCRNTACKAHVDKMKADTLMDVGLTACGSSTVKDFQHFSEYAGKGPAELTKIETECDLASLPPNAVSGALQVGLNWSILPLLLFAAFAMQLN